MAATARLLARISRRGVASAAVAGVARRRPEAASLLGASALAAAAEPCASLKVIPLLNQPARYSTSAFQRFGFSTSAPQQDDRTAGASTEASGEANNVPGIEKNQQAGSQDSLSQASRRAFYISLVKLIGKFLPVRVWRKTKTEWFRLITTQRGCRLLLQSGFLRELRSYMQEEDLERTKKFGSAKVCLGSSFAEHNRMKRNLYHFKYFSLLKRRKEEEENRKRHEG